MYSLFRELYEEFAKAGSADPLGETLHAADILSGGALRKTGRALLEEKGITTGELAVLRQSGKPLEYILGMAPFMGRLLHCAPGALIPREETELLAGTCIAAIRGMQREKRDITVIELGTGCGNIAVSIALGTENTAVYASDVSADAVEVARRNVELFGVGDRVSLFCGDLFAPMKGKGLEGRVDLVVCNPPYIPTGSLEKLASEIIDHEPVVALDAGAYGIDIFRRLVADSPVFLRSGGVLAFEIGAGQDKLVARLFNKSGAYENIGNYDDGENIRVFSAVKK